MSDGTGGDPGPQELTAAAVRVLERLRVLAGELTSLERAVLGSLVAPGIAEALDAEADVAGFGLVDWDPEVLPRALAEAVRNRRVELVFGDG